MSGNGFSKGSSRSHWLEGGEKFITSVEVILLPQWKLFITSVELHSHYNNDAGILAHQNDNSDYSDFYSLIILDFFHPINFDYLNDNNNNIIIIQDSVLASACETDFVCDKTLQWKKTHSANKICSQKLKKKRGGKRKIE